MAKKRKTTGEQKGDHEGVAPSYERFADLLPDDFPEKVKELRDKRKLKDTLEEEVRDLDAYVDAFIQATEDFQRIRCDRLVAVRQRGRSPDRILAARLLERGVSMEDIDYATEVGKDYYYVLVRENDDDIPF